MLVMCCFDVESWFMKDSSLLHGSLFVACVIFCENLKLEASSVWQLVTINGA